MADPSLTAPVEALEVFAGLLSDAEAEGGTSEAFNSRMAEATCRLAAMRRAVIFVYDEDREAVRAVGAHGIDLGAFAAAQPTAGQVEVARRALEQDRVVELTEHVEAALPEEYHPLLMGGLMTCTPMSAAGRYIGVIIADRPSAAGPLTGAQRHTLWTLGKIAALAATARNATRTNERARLLSERLNLSREIHDAVVQRLFGVSLALSGDGPMPETTRERCREEVQAALEDLRAALQRRPGAPLPETSATLHDEIDRLRRAHRDIEVTVTRGHDLAVPPELEPLAQGVLREAVRNAGKHADPTSIEIRVDLADNFVLEVLNNGVPSGARRSLRGMGLRLAAFDALEHGGLVEFGPLGDGRWRVRLTVPRDDGHSA